MVTSENLWTYCIAPKLHSVKHNYELHVYMYITEVLAKVNQEISSQTPSKIFGVVHIGEITHMHTHTHAHTHTHTHAHTVHNLPMHNKLHVHIMTVA